MPDCIKVLIDIKGLQTSYDGNDECISLSTQGIMFREEDGSIRIEYQETELTGMEGTNTTLYIKGKTVSLERRGGYNSTMVFEKNKKYLAMYATPFGTFSMSIFPSHVQTKISKDDLDLDIIYDFDFGVLAGQNRIEIKTKAM